MISQFQGFEYDVLALGISKLSQSRPECGPKRKVLGKSRCGADPQYLPYLLRGRRNRPHRSAAKQLDECAPFHHSMTSSARASSVGGISRRSAFAVVMLMIRSNLVGCSTGRSDGLAPR